MLLPSLQVDPNKTWLADEGFIVPQEVNAATFNPDTTVSPEGAGFVVAPGETAEPTARRRRALLQEAEVDIPEAEDTEVSSRSRQTQRCHRSSPLRKTHSAAGGSLSSCCYRHCACGLTALHDSRESLLEAQN